MMLFKTFFINTEQPKRVAYFSVIMSRSGCLFSHNALQMSSFAAHVWKACRTRLLTSRQASIEAVSFDSCRMTHLFVLSAQTFPCNHNTTVEISHAYEFLNNI